ncbi:MAG TPA: RDD family protein [Gemmataceae bacterium]|nr:RDD family protein [Gemmataceae bacterium]
MTFAFVVVVMLHQVVTTEKVPITYRVAGLGSRFLAWLADIGLIAVLVTMGLAASLPLDLVRPGVGSAVAFLWIFTLQWGYFLLFEWLWAGQTPGKRLLGLRVLQMDGTGISFVQAAVRNIVRMADAPLPAIYALGFVVAACNRHCRRLGDLAAGTLVVHMERKARAVRPLPDGPPLADKALAALVRQRLRQLDRPQQQTLLDLCLRRDQLPLRERARLFRATADYFEKRLGLTRDEFQSDEKCVLQLAALLGDRTPAEESAPRFAAARKAAGRAT